MSSKKNPQGLRWPCGELKAVRSPYGLHKNRKAAVRFGRLRSSYGRCKHAASYMWPLHDVWKSNRNLFSNQSIYHLSFVYYSRFHTWYTSCGQLRLRIFYWISIIGYTSVTSLKRQLGPNPMWRSVWPIHWTWITSKHGENYRCWRVVRIQEVDMKVLHIAYQEYYSVSEKLSKSRLFHSLCLRGLPYRNRDPNSTIWDYG